MKSWAAKCLAVRRVTQDNKGKQTAGVDGKKSLTPKQRLDLVKALNPRDGIRKAKPTRRVWIPKPGRDEKRPLGIPTMHDRAMQALAKLALEPEWEALFEPNQYGFRPGSPKPGQPRSTGIPTMGTTGYSQPQATPQNHQDY